MSLPEDPDRALERWATQKEERMLARERSERLADHTPVSRSGRMNGSPGGEGPRVTTPMVVLAWTVLHGRWADARDAGRMLAELVLEADQ